MKKKYLERKSKHRFKYSNRACILLLLPIILYSADSHANKTIMHLRSWNKLSIQNDIKECPKFHYLVEPNIRFLSNEYKLFSLILMRGGIGYSLRDSTEFWLGGDYILSHLTPVVRQQGRIWYQVLYKSLIKNKCEGNDIAFSFRNRLEQRMESHQQGISWRLRQQFQFQIPIQNFRYPDKYKAVFYNEMFFNLNRVAWVPPNFVDQNRLFLGFNTRLSKNTSLTIAYLNQYMFNRNINMMNHILYLILYIK